MSAAPPLAPPRPSGAAPSDGAPTYPAAEILRGGDTARIVLGAQVYTLRLTRAGKLILTK